MNEYEQQYQRTGRLLGCLFVLYVPMVELVGCLTLGLIGAYWPLFATAALYMGSTFRLWKDSK